jgi:RNA polymerase sigma factor (sigma-70 family)
MPEEGKPQKYMVDPENQEVIDEVSRVARGVVRSYRIDPSFADDFAQNVLVALVREKAELKSEHHLRSYLRTAVKNEIIDQWKKTGRGMEIPMDEEIAAQAIISETPGPLLQSLARERKNVLADILKQLNPAEIELLKLINLNYKPKQIADRGGITAENARQRIHRLKEKMRVAIDAVLGESPAPKK